MLRFRQAKGNRTGRKTPRDPCLPVGEADIYAAPRHRPEFDQESVIRGHRKLIEQLHRIKAAVTFHCSRHFLPVGVKHFDAHRLLCHGPALDPDQAVPGAHRIIIKINAHRLPSGLQLPSGDPENQMPALPARRIHAQSPVCGDIAVKNKHRPHLKAAVALIGIVREFFQFHGHGPVAKDRTDLSLVRQIPFQYIAGRIRQGKPVILYQKSVVIYHNCLISSVHLPAGG